MAKKQEKLLCLGMMKEDLSAYPSPVVLTSRNVTKDKRLVIDFRYLNSTNNLTQPNFPLLRDTFIILGNLKCETLNVLNLKDTSHTI